MRRVVIKGIQSVFVEKDGTAVLYRGQKSLGSAYMKCVGQVLTVVQSGYPKVKLVINPDHPYKQEILAQMHYLDQLLQQAREGSVKVHIG